MKLRQAERQQRCAELAEAQRAGELLAQQAELIAGEIKEVRNRCLAAAAPGPIEVDRLIATQRYGQVLRARSSALAQRTARVTAEIEQRRLAWVEADRQVRILEKLRDRHWETHRTDELRREVATLDEVAHSRRQGRE